MNSYELSREWFDWCFENTSRISPSHTALYFFIIEHNNRLGWKEEFGLPRQMAMDAIGIRNQRTFTKIFNDLENWKFLKVIQRSKNQYSANIIALSKNTKASTKALDKAMLKHGHKHDIGIARIDKHINKETYKQENGENSRAFEFLKDNYPSRFETDFQMKYGKKIEKKKKFVEDFNDTVESEKLQFDSALFGRLGKYARNWIENQNKYKPKTEEKANEVDQFYSNIPTE